MHILCVHKKRVIAVVVDFVQELLNRQRRFRPVGLF